MTKDANTCQTCKRGKHYFEGCSIVECPKRRLLSACPPGYDASGYLPYQQSENKEHDPLPMDVEIRRMK